MNNSPGKGKLRTPGSRRMRAETLLDDVLSFASDIRNSIAVGKPVSCTLLLEIEAARDRLSSVSAAIEEAE